MSDRKEPKLVKPNYECHITLRPHGREEVDVLAKKHGFKTSVIAGDVIMGDSPFLYCTCHDMTEAGIRIKMEALSKELPCKILRKKIEHIIYDERF